VSEFGQQQGVVPEESHLSVEQEEELLVVLDPHDALEIIFEAAHGLDVRRGDTEAVLLPVGRNNQEFKRVRAGGGHA
jgi:hypothetical protein